ncbi:MAG: DUF4440 domain-containing protein [Acidobacteriota bacterium]|nr:DUF4440 domain-containing protein [Acidobacteriota bacterium]
MRTARVVLVGVLVLGLAPVVAAEESALMAEVKALGDALSEAMMADDVDFMLGMYAEGAISLPNYGPRMDGVEAFRQHHEQMAAAGMKINSFTSDPTDVWEAGDQVIEIGTFEISLDMPGMPGIQDKGKYLTVYVRDADGNLKVKAETWNTDMNPMEMGAMEEHGHDAMPREEMPMKDEMPKEQAP